MPMETTHFIGGFLNKGAIPSPTWRLAFGILLRCIARLQDCPTSPTRKDRGSLDHGRFVISNRICEFAFFSAIIFPRSYHHIGFLIWLSVKQVAILSHFFYDTKMRVSNFSDLEEFSKNLPLHYYQYLQQKKPIAKEWLRSSYMRCRICSMPGCRYAIVAAQWKTGPHPWALPPIH